MIGRQLLSRRTAAFAGSVALLAVATPALAQNAVADKWRWLTFLVFAVIIGFTMFVTYFAAKRVKTASDFYTCLLYTSPAIRGCRRRPATLPGA